MRLDNPFSASHAYRPLSPQKAVALMKALDPEQFAFGQRRLPRMGYEVRVANYWLANESGTYYFKHPGYLKERA